MLEHRPGILLERERWTRLAVDRDGDPRPVVDELRIEIDSKASDPLSRDCDPVSIDRAPQQRAFLLDLVPHHLALFLDIARPRATEMDSRLRVPFPGHPIERLEPEVAPGIEAVEALENLARVRIPRRGADPVHRLADPHLAELRLLERVEAIAPFLELLRR